MKSAPYSVIPVLFCIYLASAIIGALVAVLASGLGLTTLIGLIVAGFLPLPFGGWIRSAVGEALGAVSQSNATPPTLGTLSSRLLLGLIVAGIVGFLMSLAPTIFALNAISGAFAAIASLAVVSIIFASILTNR